MYDDCKKRIDILLRKSLLPCDFYYVMIEKVVKRGDLRHGFTDVRYTGFHGREERNIGNVGD